jgi:LPXTG-motif cell wall-anchored protein
MVLLSVAPAMAQQYPPSPAGAGQGAGAGGGQDFAVTGAETMPLLWIGLALLVAGAVLVMAVQRRAAVRGRSRSITEAIT